MTLGHLNVQVELCLKPSHPLESSDYVHHLELCFCQLRRVCFDTEMNSLSPCCGQGLVLETAGIQSRMHEIQIWALGAKKEIEGPSRMW